MTKHHPPADEIRRVGISNNNDSLPSSAPGVISRLYSFLRFHSNDVPGILFRDHGPAPGPHRFERLLITKGGPKLGLQVLDVTEFAQKPIVFDDTGHSAFVC